MLNLVYMEFQVAMFPIALIIAVASALEHSEDFRNIAAKHFGAFEQIILVRKISCFRQKTAVILLIL